jgi:putative transposase
VDAMRAKTRISERRACALMGLSRTVLHYAPCSRPRNDQLRVRIQQLAAERRRFGYRRIHALLRREGVAVNVKRVHRLYCQDALQVRRRRKRRGVAVERRPLLVPQSPSQLWSIDFVMDALEHGRRIKCLTIVDDFTKEAIDIVVDHGISGHYVTRVLDQAGQFRRLPRVIRTDQGPEFTGKALDQWAYDRGVSLRLIQAGKPMQNAYVESFNGKFQDECLNEHWFRSLAEARQIIGAWRMDYNQGRPHSALGYRTPAEFAAVWRAQHGRMSFQERTS